MCPLNRIATAKHNAHLWHTLLGTYGVTKERTSSVSSIYHRTFSSEVVYKHTDCMMQCHLGGGGGQYRTTKATLRRMQCLWQVKVRWQAACSLFEGI